MAPPSVADPVPTHVNMPSLKLVTRTTERMFLCVLIIPLEGRQDAAQDAAQFSGTSLLLSFFMAPAATAAEENVACDTACNRQRTSEILDQSSLLQTHLAPDVAGCMVRTDANADPWISPAGFKRGDIMDLIRLAHNPTEEELEEEPSTRVSMDWIKMDWMKILWKAGQVSSGIVAVLMIIFVWTWNTKPHILPPAWLEAQGPVPQNLMDGDPKTLPDYTSIVESINTKKDRLRKCKLKQDTLSVMVVVEPNGSVRAAGASYLPKNQRLCVRRKLLGMVLKRRPQRQPPPTQRRGGRGGGNDQSSGRWRARVV